MTRHVFSNAMVAHVWAQQNQDLGRSGNGNLWFEGPTIYSYREPIGRFIEAADGRTVVLLTSESYSITTSCHCHRVASALRSESALPRFHVPLIAGNHGDVDHAYNLARLLERARKQAGKVKSARFDSWDSRPVVLRGKPHAPGADWEYAADLSMPGPDGSRPLFLQYAAEAFDVAARYAATFGLAVDFDGPAESKRRLPHGASGGPATARRKRCASGRRQRSIASGRANARKRPNASASASIGRKCSPAGKPGL